jgi:hypothetical protein
MNALPTALASDPTRRRMTWREFRERLKARFAADLRERFLLRVHFVAILAGTVFAGTLAAKIALDLGLHSMAWRYLLGLGVAYLSFVALVRLWIAYLEGYEPEPDLADFLDGYDFLSNVTSDPGRAPHPGGGGFGGGGAQGSWGEPSSAPSSSNGASWDVDFDDGVAILLLVVLSLAVIGGLAYLVAIGPGILTEAAFEVILAGSLARRSGWTHDGRWLKPVVRSSALPFLIVAALTLGFTAFAQDLCPEAIRLRDVFECIRR